MLHYRPIDIKRDKNILLELQCQINYACESPYFRDKSYEKYKKKWMSTEQTKVFLSRLRKSIRDKRTIAKIVEENKKVIGYFWVQFFDIIGYDVSYAEISELAVIPEYQRKGIATKMISYIENEVRNPAPMLKGCMGSANRLRDKLHPRMHRCGVNVIRSGTGILNIPSQKLHKKLGYLPIRMSYEKILKKK